MRFLVFDLHKDKTGLDACIGGYDTIEEAAKQCTRDDWYEVYDTVEDSLYEPSDITGPREWHKIRNYIKDRHQKRR